MKLFRRNKKAVNGLHQTVVVDAPLRKGITLSLGANYAYQTATPKAVRINLHNFDPAGHSFFIEMTHEEAEKLANGILASVEGFRNFPN